MIHAPKANDDGLIFRLPLGFIGWSGGLAMTLLLWSNDHERMHSYGGAAFFCFTLACCCTFPSTGFISLRILSAMIIAAAIGTVLHAVNEFAQGRAKEPPFGPAAFAGFLLWIFVPTLIHGSFDRLGRSPMSSRPMPRFARAKAPTPSRRDAWGLGITSLFAAVGYAARAWLGDPNLEKELSKQGILVLATVFALIGVVAVIVSTRQSMVSGAHWLVKVVLTSLLAFVVLFASAVMLIVALEIVAK